MIVPSLTTEQRNAVQAAYDYLISEYAEECRLIYPAAREQCPNCIWDASRNASSGKYKAGGPIPFTGTVCPYCQGQGYRMTEISDTVQLKIFWLSINETAKIAKSEGLADAVLNVPYGIMETRFFATDVPKIYRAASLVAQVPTEGYKHQNFIRITEPRDRNSLIQGRYFSCYWARHG